MSITVAVVITRGPFPLHTTHTVRRITPRPLAASSADASGGLLDLTHRRPATTHAAAHIDVSFVREDGEDERRDPCSPAEPEERGRGLGFAAAALRVGAAVCDVVCQGVALLHH